MGQNLIPRLKAAGWSQLVVLDKHAANLQILRGLHPELETELVDLAEPGPWQARFKGAEAVVILQAQIGGLDPLAFQRNNVDATRHVLDAMRQYQVGYAVQISSSVVESVADDDYTNTKKAQEQLFLDSGIAGLVLRPTLMFGWFDRKHLGWLARFMRRTPLFPVPGDGRFMRQPLYAGDFAAIIASCLESRPTGQVYDISGLEKIDYVDIIREVRRANRLNRPIVGIPYGLFRLLLQAWALFDQDPPFTAAQLKALCTHEEFAVIDWPGIFNVTATPLAQAMDETFQDPRYSAITLRF